jgi:hypothetical protein
MLRKFKDSLTLDYFYVTYKTTELLTKWCQKPNPEHYKNVAAGKPNLLIPFSKPKAHLLRTINQMAILYQYFKIILISYLSHTICKSLLLRIVFKTWPPNLDSSPPLPPSPPNTAAE